MSKDQTTDETPKRSRRKSRRRWIRPAVGAALIGAAVVTEVKKPKEGRTGVGKVAGFIPYDLRRPTFARAKERWWNSSDSRVFVPKVFGAGWTVNFKTLVNKISRNGKESDES